MPVAARRAHDLARSTRVALQRLAAKLDAGASDCCPAPRHPDLGDYGARACELGRRAKVTLKSRLGLAAAGHGAPHALGGGGHVDIGDAERRQSIHHSVHDRGRRADGAGLAAAFGTQRVVRAERGVGLELERKEIVGTRRAIVHERACLELPALVVIKRFS